MPGACEAPCVPQRRDARLSALHLGDFRLRVRASVSGIASGDACSELLAARVVVPGGRFPRLPRLSVTSRSRGTPSLAPPSGLSPETPLIERGWMLLPQLRYVVNRNIRIVVAITAREQAGFAARADANSPECAIVSNRR